MKGLNIIINLLSGNGVWESEESSQEQVWRSNEDEVAGKEAWDIEVKSYVEWGNCSDFVIFRGTWR